MRKRPFIAVLAAMSIFMGITAYAGEWKQDDTGYWYEENGSYIVSAWQEIGGNWYHFDQNGYMQTGWFTEEGTTYYLDPTSGAMVSGVTMTIDGVSYQFHASGAANQAQEVQDGWSGNTYTSTLMNYAITIPDSYTNVDTGQYTKSIDDYQAMVGELGVGRADGEALIIGVYYPSYDRLSAAEMAETMSRILLGDGSPYVLRERTTRTLGGSTYEVVKLNFADVLYQDLYIKKEGGNMLLLQVVYVPAHSAEVEQIVSTIRNVH